MSARIITTFTEDREMVLVRELTKVYEEIIRGKVSEVRNQIGERSLKGEITLVTSGKTRLQKKSAKNVDEGIGDSEQWKS